MLIRLSSAFDRDFIKYTQTEIACPPVAIERGGADALPADTNTGSVNTPWRERGAV